ncbi:hypothetical protein D1867_10640 [Acidianus infernus]|uniref:Uncharacterized protein n=1 Tax=Acidianus infernus TaxID=12915 RepID=A0A6A9QFZ3_ACIIN|nr:hypothetical protein [Acidianus infernus]MUM65689.1 hypothetical protein [Acidianus infernus]
MTTIEIIDLIIGFLVAWIIVSIPVWLAAKVFNSRSSFLRAMAASLLAIIVFEIIVAIFIFIAFVIPNPIIVLIGFIIAIIGVLGVFKGVFDVSWLGAFGIAVLAFIIAIIINFVLTAVGLGAFTITHFLKMS